jgi:hypothetical protein
LDWEPDILPRWLARLYNNSGRCGDGPGLTRWTTHATQIGKYLRFEAADGVWRGAFAFDQKRRAILLLAGDKSGVTEKRFYKQLIAKADRRFDAHLARLKHKRRK